MSAKAPLLYRLLLLLLPPRFRRYFGRDLEAVLVERLRDASGAAARAWIWLIAVVDVVTTAPAEWAHALRRQRTGNAARSNVMDHLKLDLRFALRSFARRPGFTAIAVITLALGIGANAAVFSMLDKLLLRTLPVPEPHRLVTFSGDESRTWKSQVSYPLYAELRDNNDVLSGLIALNNTSLVLDADASVDRIPGEVVSGNYFSVLGVEAALGRTFLPEEDRVPGARPVAVISHGLWERRFGSDPGVVGRSVRLNGHPFTLIGVAPKAFKGTSLGQRADIFVPVMMLGQIFPLEAHKLTAGDNWLHLMGRLSPGTSRAQAQASLDRLAARLQQDVSEDFRKRLFLDNGSQGNTDRVRKLVRPVTFLAGTAVAVILIACANLAHLLLARATVRRHEIAVRLALGAGRGRVTRQLLTESSLLSVAGGALGLFFGIGSARLLASLQPQIELNASLDLRMIGFTLVLALLTPLIFGLVPAIRTAGAGLTSPLKERSDSSGQIGRSRWFRQFLVVPQIAVSFAVLISAALCVRSLHEFNRVDLGFEPSRLLIAPLNIADANYSEERGRQFYSQLLDRVAGVPGVESASLAQISPFGGRGLGSPVRPSAAMEPTEFAFNRIGPKHFETLGTPLMQGRDIGAEDVVGGTLVTIINETAARRFWPDGEAVGQRLMLRSGPDEWQSFEIIGIVGDSKSGQLREPARPAMYVALSQLYAGDVTLHVRSQDPSADLAADVRNVVRTMDSRLPFEITPLDERVRSTLVSERMTSWLLTAFGFLALALATVGIYGVLAFVVSQRTHEIGIRTALGAQPDDVLRLILRQGMRLTVAGIITGLALALLMTRFLRVVLFNVSPTDPLTFAAIPLLLACVAVLACWLPARRAAKIDPLRALRRG